MEHNTNNLWQDFTPIFSLHDGQNANFVIPKNRLVLKVSCAFEQTFEKNRSL